MKKALQQKHKTNGGMLYTIFYSMAKSNNEKFSQNIATFERMGHILVLRIWTKVVIFWVRGNSKLLNHALICIVCEKKSAKSSHKMRFKVVLVRKNKDILFTNVHLP